MAGAKKISDEQFLSVLRENAGLYARTAKAIKKQFNIPYSRQAVRDRAETFQKELEDIAEENLDIAEEGLMTIMRTGSENNKLRAIELILKTKGRKRGYIEKLGIEFPDNVNITFTRNGTSN